MLANSVTTAAHQMKVFKPFRLDTVNQCLWRAESRMPLTPKAFDVLRYLVEHAGRLVTPDEVLEALWPETYINDGGAEKWGHYGREKGASNVVTRWPTAGATAPNVKGRRL